MIPTLAVVGHPNKGKSSIVATLSENADIKISPIPGTTQSADHYTLKIGADVLYDLIDTPGFQRAAQLHNWLVAHSTDASDRAELVRRFVLDHRDDPKFMDECTLLTPILQGAGILYVVDGSKPYGPEYELEMDVLRWTGQPRMALMNMIGEADYRESWRAGLGQYFSIVREFDAQKASFDQRLGLLQAFSELQEEWRTPLVRAVETLKNERTRQLQQSGEIIADMLQTALVAKVDRPIGESEDVNKLMPGLSEKLQTLVRGVESEAQKEVQRAYRHESTDVSRSQLEWVTSDIFTAQTWQLFGLSKLQLVTTGAASGAIAGGSLDLLLGGTSMLMGTVIGTVIGSVSAWFGGPELAKINVLGSTLGGETATAGPIKDPNLPWVLLGRACLHHALISERNHAARNQVIADLDRDREFFDFLTTKRRGEIERVFSRIRKGDAGMREELQPLVVDVLTIYQS